MVLKKLFREKANRFEYVLVSRKDPTRKLKWFGKKRPSESAVAKEESRIQYFKHFGSNVNVRAHLRKGRYVQRHLRKKHPQKLGTFWKGKKFIHGKRKRQPSEFSTLWTMKPSEVKTRFHKKLPRLPEGSKVIIGPLKKGGIEIQSYLKPIK